MMNPEDPCARAACLWLQAGLAATEWSHEPDNVKRELDLIARWLRRRLVGGDIKMAKVLEAELGNQVKLVTKRAYRPRGGTT